MEPALVDVSVLILFFNRPKLLAQVFEQVKKARPARLFLYQDGPRGERDMPGIEACRKVVADIDWECEVHHNYQEKNYGCDPSEYMAQKWAFSLSDKCIVLEDDDVPAVSFFGFCKELLDKPADVVLMNGFEDDFVPKGSTFTGKRKRARSTMLRVANSLLGQEFDDDTLIFGTSGRYEFKNKGIDVFLESLNRLNRDKDLKKKVLAFVNVPGWVGDPREDLQKRLKSKNKFTEPLQCPFITHWLHNMTHDQVLDMLKYLGWAIVPKIR